MSGEMTTKKHHRILIIDDEPDVIAYLTMALEDNGYEVLAASDSRKALTLARGYRPDLVCLDIVMPNQTGISLYHDLRTDDTMNCVPIIIISGLSPEQREHSFSVMRTKYPLADIREPDAIIDKPIDLKSFLTTLSRLLYE